MALLALFLSATGERLANCSEMMDAATTMASTLPAELTAVAGVVCAVSARFGAARVLNGLCATCRGCERGVTGESARVMARTPGS